MLKDKSLFNPCNFISQFSSAKRCNTFFLFKFRTFIADKKITIPVELQNFYTMF